MRKRGGAPLSPFHVIVAAALLYAIFLLLVSPRVPVSTTTTATRSTSPRTQLLPLSLESDVATATPTPPRPDDVIIIQLPSTVPPPIFSTIDYNQPNSTVQIDRSATEAFHVGRQLLVDLLVSPDTSSASPSPSPSKSPTTCPTSISLTGDEFVKSRNRLMELPCGLTLGSHITVVAKPRGAHQERDPKINAEGGEVLVSQFMMELLGIKMVDGEEPPKIFHFNPRLKGDFTGKPVIEQNTCYRMQWGPPLRCGGSRSKHDEDTGKRLVS